MENEKPPRKGFFGLARLPLSASYLYPGSRNRLLAISAGVALLAALVLLLNITVQRGSFVSNGPLSSAHASLAVNCVACHTPYETVADTKCAVCHEKFSDSLGTYTFASHYVYRSADRTRAYHRSGETTCFACHVEHTGRTTDLTAVPDARCESCHTFSFTSGHPEFDFAAESIPDDMNLMFTHVKHVERVMEERQVELELACLTCHNAEADGALFEPISFDRHCASCHLGPEVQSEALDVRAGGTPILDRRGEQPVLALGVETLATIRSRLGPGEDWALSASPASFETEGGQVTKFGIEHRDPWILHNLRELRRAAYPDSELADLLRASPEIPDGEKRRLYTEAVGTLRSYADGLRGRSDPAVQQELTEINRLLGEVEDRVASSAAVLAESRFRIAFTALTQEQSDEVAEYAEFIAQPCVTCHTIARATISRVQSEQQTLRRANFNHRAHVLQRDCLSCHTSIPFFENFDVAGAIDPSVDSARIHNLPRIEVCQSCHTPTQASSACLTCHDFHATKNHLSGLRLD